jgi:hypothetical protein
MAIVDGKRLPGVHFYKLRGKKEWFAWHLDDQTLYGLCAAIEEGENPMEARFRYCSIVTQPVFIDGIHHPGWPDREHYVRSSWKQMPEEWRQIFRRDLLGAGEHL